MIIKLFNNKIFAPNKCGTRYLEEIFKYEYYEFDNLPKLDESYFIIREPFEHLKSALHTELLGYRKYKKLNKSFKRFLVDGGNLTSHFSNILYKSIYHYKLKNKNCKIIELKNLTEFVREMGYNIEYDSKKYNFIDREKDWVDKDIFYEELKLKFPNEISILENHIENEMKYYKKLIGNKIEYLSIL